ncbi:translocation/assembly module TamB domain-containing protein (plasmid) [Paracoccus sp. TK19116]|uniref:Translocation/assembly module TamB domain-containing protein n=1 Tax=Paracoccus albicereus TaxID=2922394 RepID=A0ABT1MLZ0_9RHOB|nr:translocation/assembly module TamB domain-containing protein [Paracoccus albicereus]MCQ0969191.1 translocation/assembly module TamB domain-containing protein [Paracoccus albicereus]
MRKLLILMLLVLIPAILWGQDAAEISEEVEDDRGFITRLLEENLSGAGRQVTLDGFRGALSSRATFERLTIADDEGVWITLTDGAIQWNRSALLRRRIEIAELSAASIDLPRLPGAGEAERTAEAPEFALPDLPVSIEIGEIRADRVTLGEPVIGIPAAVSLAGNMNLAGGEGTANLNINRLDGPRGEFVLDAGYSNETKVLSLDLTLDEAADGLLVNLVDLYDKPAVNARISGEGPLSDFAADITLATDGQPRVTGRASARAAPNETDNAPGTAFRLELGGDVASLLPPEDRTFFGTSTQLLAEGWRGDDGRLDLPVLMIDTQALNLSGSLSTTSEGAPQSAVLLMTLGADAGATELPVVLPFGSVETRVNDGSLTLQYDASESSGWTLRGRVGQIERDGTTIGALRLDGEGTVALDGNALQDITGRIEFGAEGLGFADAGLAQAIGDSVQGTTGFDFTPGNALQLDDLSFQGSDYGLDGVLLVAGLGSGITVSADLDARYEDLSRLSTLAGRPVTGRADASVEGYYTVLSKAFDIDANVTGSDITVNQDQIDRLLGGASEIVVVARRDEAGIELTELSVNAQRLTANAEGTITSGSSDVRATISMPALSDMDAELGGSVEAEAFLNGPAGQRRLTVSGEAMDLRTGITELDAALQGRTSLAVIAGETEGGYEVEQFQFGNPQIRAEGQGVFAPGRLDADLDLSVPDLAAFGRGWSGSLEAKAQAREENGTRFLDVTGQGQELRLGQENVDGALTGTTDLKLTAEERDGVFTIRDLDITNQQLTAQAQGVYGEGVTDLTADLNIASLASFGRGWQGSLAAQGRVRDDGEGTRQLELTGTGDDLALGQSQADGVLSGTTRLSVRAEETGGIFTIDEARIDNEQAVIEASGVYGGTKTDLQANVDLRDLGALGLGWRGSFVADATYADDGSGVRQVSIEGTGQDLALGQADLDAALSGPTQLSLQGTEQGGVFTIEDTRIANANLNATATGRVGGGSTDLSATLRAGDLRFLGRGISGSIDAQGRVVEEGGTRQITANGSAGGLSIGNERADALLRGQTTFDVAASQTGEQLSVSRLVVRNPQVTINADGAPQTGINLNATLSDLALVQPGFPGPAQLTGTVREDGPNFVLDLTATGPGGTRAQVAGRAARDFSDTDLRISGVSDAAVANPLIRTRSIEGPINFDIRVQGQPSLDAISGRVQLVGGAIAEPKLGVRLDPVNVTADIAGGAIAVNGTAGVEAGGQATVNGTVDLQGGATDIAVQLADVVARDPNLYEARVNGNVRFTAGGDGQLISGRIDVAEAEIRIPSTGLGGAKAIPEIEHVGDTRPVRATRARAGLEAFPSDASRDAGLSGPPATPPANPPRLDLTINAPNQVFIRGRGVDAEMGGQLQVQGTTRNPVPIGYLELIRGRVDLLGKRFVLTEGLVELQGSLIPILRLVAVTEENSITTRIIIDGEARDPDITFESSPDMPQEEVLSQLLFGRGLDNISALQAAQLANAVAVLAGRGGEGIVGRLRSQTGLDDLDVTTDDDGGVQVRAGKYLSENVYTDLSVGDDGKTEINLNLDVTESLRARASAGSDGESAIGLYYERDY